MIRRLRDWLHVMAVALDCWMQTIIFGFAHVLDLAPKPRVRDTISAVVGHNAIGGRGWALVAEAVIDWIFERLGEAPGHCRREAAEANF
jgi:hypothetical protein